MNELRWVVYCYHDKDGCCYPICACASETDAALVRMMFKRAARNTERRHVEWTWL